MIGELYDILIIINDNKDLKEELISESDLIIRSYKSLIEIDQTSLEIRFIYQTIDDFLYEYYTKRILSSINLI
jgi:hypothetical protein